MDEGLLGEKADVLSFPLFESLPIDTSTETYRQNFADWAKVLKTYQEGLEWCASQGTEHYEERHKERGLLLGSYFLNRINDSTRQSSSSP